MTMRNIWVVMLVVITSARANAEDDYSLEGTPSYGWSLNQQNWSLPETNWSVPSMNWTKPSMNWTNGMKNSWTSEKTAFKITRSPICSGLFAVSSFEHYCADNCAFGSNVTLDGTVYTDNGFWRNETLTLKVCPVTSAFGCYKVVESPINLCSILTPLNGQSCPRAGKYSFHMTFNLPSEFNKNWYWGWPVTVAALFSVGGTNGGSEANTKCTFGIKTVEATTAQDKMVWSLAGLALLASATFFGIKERRAVLASRLEDDEGIEFRSMSESHHVGRLV